MRHIYIYIYIYFRILNIFNTLFFFFFGLFRLCLVHVKYFPENKYFLEMLFYVKGKHVRLFDCIVKIMPENYFLCLVLHVKNLFSEKETQVNPLPALGPATATTKEKHNPPPTTQNPDREEEKNRPHCSVTTKIHQNTTTHTTTITTKSEIKEKESQT